VNIVLAGVSHKTAPVALRERLAFAGAPLGETLLALSAATEFPECAVLSTCNRSEVYAVTRAASWQEEVVEFLADHARLSPGQVQEHLYCFEGMPAVRHLFRVAGGLDSMVIGEAQILAQVKEALQGAQEAGTSGTLIHSLFQHAAMAGKRARSQTEISRGAVSISLAAVQLAKQIFGRLSGHSVLLFGAGENSEQTARLLLNEGVSRSIAVCNRTEERAAALAERIGGTVVPLSGFAAALASADIVISSTGAPQPILRREEVQAAMRQRRGRPIFLIDIAVPRDVDPEAADLDDLFLYNIDDLQAVVDKSLALRQSEVERVDVLVEEEVERFLAWLRTQEVGPTITALQQHAERIRTREMELLRERLGQLSPEEFQQIESSVRGVVNKLLHHPMVHLRTAAASGNGYHEIESIRAIFGLDGTASAAEEPLGSKGGERRSRRHAD